VFLITIDPSNTSPIGRLVQIDMKMFRVFENGSVTKIGRVVDARLLLGGM
jgi:hypothetical protein